MVFDCIYIIRSTYVYYLLVVYKFAYIIKYKALSIFSFSSSSLPHRSSYICLLYTYIKYVHFHSHCFILAKEIRFKSLQLEWFNMILILYHLHKRFMCHLVKIIIIFLSTVSSILFPFCLDHFEKERKKQCLAVIRVSACPSCCFAVDRVCTEKKAEFRLYGLSEKRLEKTIQRHDL